MSDSASDRRTTDSRRILVINDTMEILELFDEILSGMGHEVTLLSYAPDELRQIEEARPDLLIVDFVLGGREMEGWQLLQKMRMNRSTAKIPIIACTAASQVVREQEGYLTQQGVAVVLKPFNVAQLENAVEVALKTTPASAAQRLRPASHGARRAREAAPSGQREASP